MEATGVGRKRLFYVLIWWAVLPMWNLVCLKLLSRRNFLSPPTIHNFEMLGDVFMVFFRTWGELCHSTTNTNCFVRAISLSCKSVVWIPYRVTFPLQLLIPLGCESPSSSWEDFLTINVFDTDRWRSENRSYMHHFHTDKANTFLGHWFNGEGSRKVELFPTPRESYLFFPYF